MYTHYVNVYIDINVRSNKINVNYDQDIAMYLLVCKPSYMG